MPSLTLDQTTVGVTHTVAAVNPPVSSLQWGPWLEDIGFVVGEQVTLIRRSPIGGDPIVVRVGHSTFALRLAEAACVELQPITDSLS